MVPYFIGRTVPLSFHMAIHLSLYWGCRIKWITTYYRYCDSHITQTLSKINIKSTTQCIIASVHLPLFVYTPSQQNHQKSSLIDNRRRSIDYCPHLWKFPLQPRRFHKNLIGCISIPTSVQILIRDLSFFTGRGASVCDRRLSIFSGPSLWISKKTAAPFDHLKNSGPPPHKQTPPLPVKNDSSLTWIPPIKQDETSIWRKWTAWNCMTIFKGTRGGDPAWCLHSFLIIRESIDITMLKPYIFISQAHRVVMVQHK